MKFSPKIKALMKRFGWAGLLFFTIKGIVTLVAGKYIIEWLFK